MTTPAGAAAVRHTDVFVETSLQLDATATFKIGSSDVTSALSGVIVQGIALNDFRAPAAWKDALGDTATAAILGLADTRGSVLLATAASGTSVNQSAVTVFRLPPTYIPGNTVTLRVRGKQATTLLTVGTTVDAVVKLIGDTLGSDICTTAAQTVTTAYANYDFTITPTGLVAGDLLAIEVFVIEDDTGGTVNTAGSISRVEVRLAGAA